MKCPCGSNRAYAVCCGPLHDGEPATTAEALMRARYSAYALGKMAYVADSWHPDTRPVDLENAPGHAVRWLGLSIKSSRLLDEDTAEVEFVARFREGGGRAARLHETSRFVREQGRWYYRDGVLST